MSPTREQVLAREREWALPVALAGFAAVGLLAAAMVVINPVEGDGDAEVLRSVHAHSGAVIGAGILQTVAFLLLVGPLVYLFRAAQARSEMVRGQLIGLVVAGPLFLSGAAILTAVATDRAASDFVAGKVSAGLTTERAAAACRAERRNDATAFREEFGVPRRGGVRRCAAERIADSRAERAIVDTPARSISTGLGFGGRIGLAFALLYTCLWAMRTGLLTRFWGSLGMAMGAAALLLLIQFTFFWFLYFAFLAAGWVPGGRPPAWAAGEAIPWPTPGEKAAEELGDGDEEDEPPERPEGGEPRKRKRRE